MRTTANDARVAFERVLVPAIGGRLAKGYDDVGGFILNNNPDIGGFVVEKIVSTSGKTIRPLGERRLATREFVDTCYMIRDAIKYKE